MNQPTKEQALEACPFCKCDYPRYHFRKSGSAVNGHHFIRCPMCHTEGPRSLIGGADAIEKWNTRP